MNFDPIFGEDNEIIGWTDDLGNDWSVEEAETYWDITGDYPESYEPDDVWADADALASIGWGTDEDYGYYGE